MAVRSAGVEAAAEVAATLSQVSEALGLRSCVHMHTQRCIALDCMVLDRLRAFRQQSGARVVSRMPSLLARELREQRQTTWLQRDQKLRGQSGAATGDSVRCMRREAPRYDNSESTASPSLAPTFAGSLDVVFHQTRPIACGPTTQTLWSH